MRKFWLLLSILFIWTCGGGGKSSPTEPEVPPIVINLTSLGGQAQKGPFNNGTAINIAELTSALSPTGRNFSSAITDNTGRFAVANVELESPYVELRANGYYFNEVSNEISSGQLTLFALSNLTGKTSLNVNIITHLEKNRMVTLMSGDSPKTFAQAKLQAQEEVFAVFDYSRANVPESELLDISQGGAANGKLLAMSAIIQGDLTVGQMSQLLANISTDIASDGTLDDTNLRNTLIDNSQNLDMAEVRSNLVAHYSSLGISATIPDFETEINQFLKPPVSQDMSVSTAEDTAINITLAGSDPEGESLTYTILEVNNATVTLSGNVANYVPDTHFNGTDTFTYYANDGTSDSNIATVTMTVSAEDDEPNTIDVATTTDEDVAVTVNLSADEYDGDSYSFAIITDVTNGTTSLNGSTVTYTPNQDFNGEDTFTFEATDDTGRTINVATATITVNPVNDAPTANDVTTSTDENLFSRNNTKIDITYDADNDILFNNNIKGTYSFDSSNSVNITLDGTDVDGDNLTYSVVTINNGSVTINGAIATYEPTQDWNGTDTFTYKVNDGSLDSNTATVTVTVNAVNDAPVSSNVNASTNEDTAKDITLSATDIEGSSLTYSVVSDVSNGSTSLSGSTVTYTPTANWNGTDTFTYKANDGTDDSNASTVTITVASVNDAPVANDITNQVTDENRMMQLDITLDATDVDGDNLTYSVVTINNGSVTINDNIATYVPNQDWNGEDTFTYIANDGSLDSNTATVTITVNSIPDAPITYNFSVETNEDFGLYGQIPLGGHSFDVDGDDLVFIVSSIPTNGNLCQDAGATCGTVLAVGDTITGENGTNTTTPVYEPYANFNGSDSFSWKVNDGSLDSNIGTVSITVNPVIDPLVSIDISLTVNEDESLVEQIDSRYASSPDGLIVNNLDFPTGPTNGTVSNNGRELTYTPNLNWNGTETFTYRATEDNNDGWSNESTITITVNPVDDLPTAIDLTASTGEDDSVDITLQYEDVDGDVWPNLTYELSSSPTNGAVTLNTEKTIATYTPNIGFFGTDAFNYSTEAGSSVEGTVTITIHERVGTLKVYPDLSTNYNEVLSDIVYDESTGGFLAIGTTYEEGDSGSAGTYDMIALEVSSDLTKVDYRKVTELSLNGGVNSLNSLSTTTYPGGGTHHYDISKESIDGNFLVTKDNDYVWSLDGTSGSNKEQVTSTWDFSADSNYSDIDYITSVTQDSNGDFIIFGRIGARRNPGAGGESYPVIAKVDANLNLKYYHVLNPSTDSKQYSAITFGVDKTASSGSSDVIYGVLAKTWRIGFQSSTQTTWYWTIADTGSNFVINRDQDLGNRDFNTGVDNDLCYIYESTGSGNTTFAFVAGSELVVVTEGSGSSGGWFEQGTYTLDFTYEPHIELVADVDSETNGNFYVITQKNTSNGNNRIQVYKFNASAGLSLLWNKTVGLNDDGDNNSYLEAIGGAAVDSQGNIAIVGTQIINYGDSNGNQNANGIIILLDSDGNRIY